MPYKQLIEEPYLGILSGGLEDEAVTQGVPRQPVEQYLFRIENALAGLLEQYMQQSFLHPLCFGGRLEVCLDNPFAERWVPLHHGVDVRIDKAHLDQLLPGKNARPKPFHQLPQFLKQQPGVRLSPGGGNVDEAQADDQ